MREGKRTIDPTDPLIEVNRLLFCEACQRRALDFLDAAEWAVCNAGTETAITIQMKVEAALESFLLSHEGCPRCKED
jgi:hypothetical protein